MKFETSMKSHTIKKFIMRLLPNYQLPTPKPFQISNFKSLIFPLVVLAFILSPIGVQKVSAACDTTNSVFGFPTWYKHIPGEETVAGKCTPILETDNLADTDALPSLILPIGIAVLEIMATIGAMVAFVMVLWGSFNFMTALGEPEKAASARRTVQNAGIGLVILLLSSQIVSFVGNAVT